MLKKVFAAILAFAMMVALLPVTALAETGGADAAGEPGAVLRTSLGESEPGNAALDEDTLAWLAGIGVTAEEYTWFTGVQQRELSLQQQAKYIDLKTRLTPKRRAVLYAVSAVGSGAVTPFLISNASQLAELAAYVNASNTTFNAAHYQMVNDIDLSAYQSGTGWTPIGIYVNGTNDKPFAGVFDGNGKTVTGLVINRPGTDASCSYQGLFGYVQGADASHKAQIKNVIVKNASVKGFEFVGAVVGRYGSNTDSLTGCAMPGGSVTGTGDHIGGIAGSSSATITSCYTTGCISGSTYIGGIVGDISASIENCYTTGNVSGSTNIGGIVGNTGDQVTNCYTTGSISGTVGSVGGVAGSAGSITNCIALGRAVSGGSDVGRVTGSGTVSNSYAWNGMTVSGSGGQNGSDLTHDLAGINPTFGGAMSIFPDSVIGTDNSKPWKDNGDMTLSTLNGFAAGTQSSALPPWITNTVPGTIFITTAAELKQLADEVNGTVPNGSGGFKPAQNKSDITYKLANDIDLSAYAPGTPLGGAYGWTPIGTAYATCFSGIFDGCGYTVTGLSINNPTVDCQGLFGFLFTSSTPAQIKNVIVKNASVVGKNYVGAVVGNCNPGVDALISCVMLGGSVAGTQHVGGVAGGAYDGVTSCYATGSVSGMGDSVGGVVGSANSISNCYATGSVLSTGEEVGGVVGSANSISNCYATGNVTGTQNVGGVAGYVDGSILSCYATGSVTGTQNVGGVVGDYLDSSGVNITNCAALGRAVSGTQHVGRVAGIIGLSSGTIIHCYAWSGMAVTENNVPLVFMPDANEKHGGNLTYDGTQTVAANKLSPQFTAIFGDCRFVKHVGQYRHEEKP